MSYVNAKATRLLASHCCVCGRPLVDAKSVELGIGPVCRKRYTTGDDITEEARIEANQLIYDASCLYGIGANREDIADVVKIADRLAFLGMKLLAERLAHRFIGIRLQVEEDVPVYRWDRETRTEVDTGRTATVLNVWTPYDEDFVYDLKRSLRSKRPVKDKVLGFHWQVPRADSRRVLEVLSRHFDGRWALGDKGAFQIPDHATFVARYETPQPGTQRDDNPPRGSEPVVTFDLRAFRRSRERLNQEKRV